MTRISENGEIAKGLCGRSGPTLSVIIPAFNEAATIESLLQRVIAAPYDKQIIVVDDGSSDATLRVLQNCKQRFGIEVFAHGINRGKGAAIRTGVHEARGRFVVIQDADLEYDPQDYPKLIEPLLQGSAQVVYGSRYLRQPEETGRLMFRTGVRMLNLAVRILYGQHLTDEATCYKTFATGLVQSLDLQCERFEFCPEVTAKLCRMGIPILEVPISYRARSAAEGKKIRLRDGIEALRTLWRWRNWQPAPAMPQRVDTPSWTQTAESISQQKSAA
jgi:dolichol-phosphate mannosyltransferase